MDRGMILTKEPRKVMAWHESDVPDWSGAKPELAKKAKEFLQEHYAEKFSLDTVAAALYVNKHYLVRAFKEATGLTLLQYLNFIRCSEANKLLKHSNVSIEVVGYTVGYVTASHFARTYKKVFQCSPSQYRKGLSHPGQNCASIFLHNNE